MNYINNFLLKNWRRCTILKIPKEVILPVINIKENLIISEQKYFFSTSSRLLAGHSKWANIKSTKMKRDSARSLYFQKISILIRRVIKEGGSSNPALNTKLKRAIESAKAHSMPSATIEAAIKNAEKSKEEAEKSTLVYSAPGGFFLVVDVFTDKVNRTRSEVNSILKKLNFKTQRGSFDGIFEEKGIVIVNGNNENALDHAIEVGAEEVTEETEGSLTFVCDPNDFENVYQGLQNLNYDIDHADVELIPNLMFPVKEEDIPKFKTAISKLEEHADVVKLHYNFDL